MIEVILLEPETPGNIGAIARIMKNFGFNSLVLVHPVCDHLSLEARNRAKHSQDILENAQVNEFFVVDDYDYLIATTARLGTEYNLTRSPLTPQELAEKVKDILPPKKIGLVIGREGHGMFNEEIAKCDFIVTVPATKEYSTLNVSHAVGILLYELHKKIGENKVNAHITPISKTEKDQIHIMFTQLYDELQWETPQKRKTQVLLWKRIIGKAMLTRREAYGVMGLLRKLLGPKKLHDENTKRSALNRPESTKKKDAAKKPCVVKAIKKNGTARKTKAKNPDVPLKKTARPTRHIKKGKSINNRRG